MKATAKAQEREDQIISAAAHVFAEKGFDYATVEEIAERAGYSDSTIYKYFANKQELLGRVIHRFTSGVESTVSQHLRLLVGAGHRIRGILGSYAKAFEQDPIFARACRMCIFQYQMLQGEDDQDPFEKLRRLIEPTLEEGIADGEFDPSSGVPVASAVLIGAVNNIVLHWLYKSQGFDLMQAVDDMLDTIFQGIVPPVEDACLPPDSRISRVM